MVKCVGECFLEYCPNYSLKHKNTLYRLGLIKITKPDCTGNVSFKLLLLSCCYHSLSMFMSVIISVSIMGPTVDFNYPHSTPGVMDFGSLLVKSEDLCAPANLSSSLGVTSTTRASLLLGGMQGRSTPPPATSQADDSPLLRSLSPVLTLSQASPGMGQEVSLANVFVPLDAIKPSEFHEIGCMFLFVFFEHFS